jgi:hypothetical protein
MQKRQSDIQFRQRLAFLIATSLRRQRKCLLESSPELLRNPLC